MNPRPIHVQTASRLHFGLFAFGRTGLGERNFGGVGMMIDAPSLALSITPSDAFEVSGPLAVRVTKFAKRWYQGEYDDQEPACRISVEAVPPQHSGFGVGTQLGLATVAGLHAFVGRPPLSAADLARLSRRGERSAVGVYGFIHGGLIVEDGKLPGEQLSPLVERADVPDQWRIVLLRPPTSPGLSGTLERDAFERLPPVSPATTKQLRAEVSQRMLPAVAKGDFEAFSESVYNYGRAAGECFAAAQGGPYNGPVLERIVKTVRQLSVKGVGQSSWGPTIYCLLPNQNAANEFVSAIGSKLSADNIEATITRSCNHGAKIESAEGASPAAKHVSCAVSPEP